MDFNIFFVNPFQQKGAEKRKEITIKGKAQNTLFL
jgi:hypothetical protein